MNPWNIKWGGNIFDSRKGWMGEKGWLQDSWNQDKFCRERGPGAGAQTGHGSGEAGSCALWTHHPGDLPGDVMLSLEGPFQARNQWQHSCSPLPMFTFQQIRALAYFAESLQKSLIAPNYLVQEGSWIMALRVLAWSWRNFPDSSFIISPPYRQSLSKVPFQQILAPRATTTQGACVKSSCFSWNGAGIVHECACACMCVGRQWGLGTPAYTQRKGWYKEYVIRSHHNYKCKWAGNWHWPL